MNISNKHLEPNPFINSCGTIPILPQEKRTLDIKNDKICINTVILKA